MAKSDMSDKAFFVEAINLAQKAAKLDEVPIGAVIVREGKIIARAYNQTEKRKTFTAHAEMLAIQSACQKLKTKYLIDCDLYVTLEPCKMCYSASRLSRIRKVHYLTKSLQFGRTGKAYVRVPIRKHRSELTHDAKGLLQEFFRKKR